MDRSVIGAADPENFQLDSVVLLNRSLAKMLKNFRAVGTRGQ